MVYFTGTVDKPFHFLFFYLKEINLFWAAHQTHHSSEDYNLSTALRQSVFQKYTSWVGKR
jgi:alkylglycerol monooxygenase